MTRAEYDVLIPNAATAFSYANFGMALAFGIVKEKVAMTNKDDRSDTSDQEDRSSTESQEAVQERLDRIANKAAQRARVREERYDAEHDLFTK
jgi:hypothetical protein